MGSEKGSTSTTEKYGARSVDVIAIPSRKVEALWPHVRGYVLSAVDERELNETVLLARLFNGAMQLWVVWDDGVIGGVVTEIANYTSMSAVRVVSLAGDDFESWREVLDGWLEKFGKLWGCDRIEFVGRKGWQRRLPNYEFHRVMMVRDI